MSRFYTLLALLNVAAVAAYSPLLPDRAMTTPVVGSDQASSEAVSRREMFSRTVAASSAAMMMLGVHPTMANAAESLTDYKDELLGFSLKVPSDWEKSVQRLPDRRSITLYFKPDSNQQTLLFFAYTSVRDDFTSLGSFGSVEEVGQATILPKSTLAGMGDVESKMLFSESKKQAYFFDYDTKVPGQPKTHFRTIFSLLPRASGAGSMLVTITAQAPESEYESVKPLFDDVIESFKPK